jgi:hypothetical protein
MKEFLVIGIFLLIFGSIVFAQEVNDTISPEIQVPPQCNPQGTFYGFCRWWNQDFPLGWTKFLTDVKIKPQSDYVNKLHDVILERQREHFQLLLQLQNGTITNSTFGQFQSQLAKETKDKLSELRNISKNKTDVDELNDSENKINRIMPMPLPGMPGKICPMVCIGLWEVKGQGCVYNECGSGCGADNVTSFKTESDCLQNFVNPEPNKCENNGGKCYGFGDFVAETCESHNMTTLPGLTCPKMTVNTQCCQVKNYTCKCPDNYEIVGSEMGMICTPKCFFTMPRCDLPWFVCETPPTPIFHTQ